MITSEKASSVLEGSNLLFACFLQALFEAVGVGVGEASVLHEANHNSKDLVNYIIRFAGDVSLAVYCS
jgi:hypothetical protein